YPADLRRRFCRREQVRHFFDGIGGEGVERRPAQIERPFGGLFYGLRALVFSQEEAVHALFSSIHNLRSSWAGRAGRMRTKIMYRNTNAPNDPNSSNQSQLVGRKMRQALGR